MSDSEHILEHGQATADVRSRTVHLWALSLEVDEVELNAAACGPLTRCSLEPPCRIINGATAIRGLEVGAFTYSWSHIPDAVRSVGRYCSIAGEVSFGATEHPVDWLSTSSMGYEKDWMWGDFSERRGGSGLELGPLPTAGDRDRITIGHDVWIGLGAYIRSGVTLGHGCVIGAHAVVTRDVPPFAVVAGNPARLIRFRFDEATVTRLLDLAWWSFAFSEFRGVSISHVPDAIDRIETLVRDGLTPYAPDWVTVTGS